MFNAKILVIDHENNLEKLIKNQFSNEIANQSYTFIFVNSSNAAISEIQKSPDIAVVFADMDIPKINSLTLLDALKKQDGFFQTIIISADSDIQSIRNSMNYGAYDFLLKPVNPADLALTLQKTLNQVNQLKEKHLEIVQVMQDLRQTEILLKQEELSRISLENTNELKDDLISFMAHEVRTPLNAILANVKLIEMAETDDEFLKEEGLTSLDLVQRIKKGGENLLELTQRMLEIQRLEAGKLVMHKHPVKLKYLIEKEIEKLSVFALSNKNQLSYEHLAQDLTVEVDEVHFTQMLQNLIGNALKFTKNGYVKICTKETKGTIIIQIEDNGCGIEKPYLSKIFDRFEQVGRKAREQQGSGLGLTYSRFITELHNGTIDVKSEPEKGSIFTVSFPENKLTQH